MKKLLFITILIFGSLGLSAQNYNPFVAQATVNPNPLNDVAASGTGQVSVVIGNSGDDPMPVNVGDEIVVKITLSNGIPNNANPLAAMGGTMLGYFNWIYDVPTKTYTGTQNQTMPGFSGGGTGSIIIQYKVTANSIVSNPLNGLLVQLLVPTYISNVSTPGDDLASSYTWTVPVCQAGSVAPITN